MHSLGTTHRSQGRYVEAAKIEEEVTDKMRRVLREEHPDTLETLQGLALVYQSQQDTPMRSTFSKRRYNNRGGYRERSILTLYWACTTPRGRRNYREVTVMLSVV